MQHNAHHPNSVNNVITYSKVHTALQKSTQQLPTGSLFKTPKKDTLQTKKKTNLDVTFINKKTKMQAQVSVMKNWLFSAAGG
jgi:hypothetical protein